MELSVVRGDITTQTVDAVVNAANHTLLGGGGVDGAIHRAGGKEILRECRQIRDRDWPEGLPTGEAVATGAGNMPARWVIHTVGPVWAKTKDKADQLASCYRRSMEVAEELGAGSVAFPLVSAGVYGWPIPDAARIAVETVRAYAEAHPGSTVEEVRFVAFSATTQEALEAAL